jgi:hypothetical protein
LTVKAEDLSSTYINFTAVISDASYVYFVIVEKGTAPPTKQDILNQNFSKTVSSGSKKTIRHVPESIDYEMNYLSKNLFPQTVYIMYLVAENGLGQSDIFLYRF